MGRIQTKRILIGDRVRVDYGDLIDLVTSIKEYGLIQPLVLVGNYDEPRLLAGRRRLLALEALKVEELEHGTHFVWKFEEGLEFYEGNKKNHLRLVSMEIEENIRRKDLTWQEQVAGKLKLLRIMQEIHGEARDGAPTSRESRGLTPRGFGIRSLAAMLGESPATVSRDLQIAEVIEKVPQLAKAATKESAVRQLSIVTAIHSMEQSSSATNVADWVLYEGDFRESISKVADKTVDLVYTDLPFGVELAEMSKHGGGVVEYPDLRASIVRCLAPIAVESYRILNDNRFAVFFFGFNYYNNLANALISAGFGVNLVPVIWYKHTRSTENPNTRYANAYDGALVAMKGGPVFIRPGQANVIDIPAIAGGQKLQIAQQPVELVERFILDMTAEGATVVDLMAGSGTTGVAAVKNKRKAILFEKEPAACVIARARLGAL